MKIGKQLSFIRNMHTLTQDEFAARILVSQPVYSCYERNEKSVPEDVVLRVVEEFNVPKDWFNAEFNPRIIFESGSVVNGQGMVNTIENYYSVPREVIDMMAKQQSVMEKMFDFFQKRKDTDA